MPLTWKKGNYTVDRGIYGKKEETGYISGVFFVFKAGKCGWNITHMPTSLKVSPEHYATKAKAQEVAARVFDMVPLENWQREENPFHGFDHYKVAELRAAMRA